MEPFNNLNRATGAIAPDHTKQLNIPVTRGTGAVETTQAVSYFDTLNLNENPRRSLAQASVSVPCAAVATPSLSDKSEGLFYIRECRDKILRDIEPKKYDNTLYSEFIIEFDDIEEIRAKPTRKTQGECLLGTVQRYFDAADLQRKKFIMTVLVNCFNKHQKHLTRFLNPRYQESTANPVREPTLPETLASLRITPGKEACEHNEEVNRTGNNNGNNFEEDIKYPVQESGRY